ncbi:MAG TPA: phosphodiester glycosidase family protein [Kofleriaceae bacterium]
MRLALAIVLAPAIAAASPVRTSQSDPHPGIHEETWVDSSVPARIQLVSIDLTSAEIALYATPEADRGITTSAYENLIGGQVAINGDSFAVAGYVPRGLAMGDSTIWSATADDATSALLHLRRVGERTEGDIVPPEVVVQPSDLPAGTQAVVSGRPLLVRNGAVETQFDCNDPVTVACERAPRSAAALDAAGNTLWLVTVDGWQADSAGLTAAELADFLLARGANLALALDGGSSATLVVDGTVANHPSDGVERTVANHIGVKYGALPKGQLVGIICDHDIFNCPTRITGATVILDDGRQQVTGSDGFYDFTDLTPRLACVTVKKTGYHTKTQCQTVDSGIQTYNSVALEAGVDGPDAGVPDGPVEDASSLGDGGGGGSFGVDGGPPVHTEPGGCCDSGGGRSNVLLALLVLGTWMYKGRE